MAEALGHQTLRYLNHQHLRLHNGRQVLREQGDGRRLYTTKEYKREELTEILQPKGEELH